MQEPPTRRSFDRTIMMVIVVALVIVLGVVILMRVLTPPPPAQVFHAAAIYESAPRDALFTPFGLHVDPMERLLLINIENDPDELYIGFEPQVFDDDVHGRGMLVIGWRADGLVDVYHQPTLSLDPATYDITGEGLANMVEAPLEGARFEVTESGVDASVAFTDVLGRPIELSVVERGHPPRNPFGLLAPMGAAAAEPSALPLVFLHDFTFVRRANTDVRIVVAGHERRPDTLPLPIDGSRMYFMRYSPDPLIATLNPSSDGPLAPLTLVNGEAHADDGVVYDLLENHGRLELQRLRRAHGEHEVRIDFMPSFPDLLGLADGVRASGTFVVNADASVGTVAGDYSVERVGDSVTVRLVPSDGWTPNERLLSVRLMYTLVPLFRGWPTTYLWTAVIDVADPAAPRMRSWWVRTP